MQQNLSIQLKENQSQVGSVVTKILICILAYLILIIFRFQRSFSLSEYESTSSKIRGKRRLVPKKKRPTKLKSIILKDRQSRKELKKTELNEQELKNLDPDNSLVTEKLEFQPQVLKTSDPEPINSPVSEKLEVQPQECDQTTELLSDNSQVVPRKVKKKKRKQSKPHSNDNEMQNEKSDPRDQIVHTCDKESATADSIQLNVKEVWHFVTTWYLA